MTKSCDTPIFTGAIGISLVVQFLECSTPVKLATEGLGILEIRIKSPSGTTTAHVATYVTDGEDGRIQFLTVDGDLSEVGNWQIQGFAQDATPNPAKVIPSSIGKFKVEASL